MKENQYKLSVIGNGINVKRDISENTARRILNLILEGSIFEETTPNSLEKGQSDERDGGGSVPTSKAFMASKRPATDIERITCLAYYLSCFKGMVDFRTIELTKLNTDASQPRLSNATFAARNAVQKDLLTLAGGGRKKITTKGEALVEALPDREKVKEALANNVLRRNRKKVKKVGKRSE